MLTELSQLFKTTKINCYPNTSGDCSTWGNDVVTKITVKKLYSMILCDTPTHPIENTPNKFGVLGFLIAFFSAIGKYLFNRYFS